ncbi:hypothetical protein F5B20DRAFT_580929 [Whalleya microplaca]|nr:hypothetical protein F5B20DRAFT_580929 [Whalleya microplaca]
MASSAHSSVQNSPVHSRTLDVATTDLQPAPLRLPQRKSEAGSDGAISKDQLLSSELEVADTSTPQRTVTKTPSQGRIATSRLGSLVSKFEVLDAVKSTENGHSQPVGLAHGAKPSGIPRSSVGLEHILPVEVLGRSSSFVEDSSATAYSPNISPKQTPSLLASDKKSMLPVSTRLRSMTADEITVTPRLSGGEEQIAVPEEAKPRWKPQASPTREPKPKDIDPTPPGSVHTLPNIAPGQDLVVVADRRKVFEDTGTHSPSSRSVKSTRESSEMAIRRPPPSSAASSFRQLSTSKSSRQSSPTKPNFPGSLSIGSIGNSKQEDYHDYESDRKEDKKVSAKEPELQPSPVKGVQRQRLSVADLRKSFERYSELPEPTLELVGKVKPEEDISASHVARSSSSIHRAKILGTGSPTKNIKTAVPTRPSVESCTRRADMISKISDQFSLPQSSVQQSPAASLPKSNRFRQQQTNLMKTNQFDGSVSPRSDIVRDDSGDIINLSQARIVDAPIVHPRKKLPHVSQMHPRVLPGSKTTAQIVQAGKTPVTPPRIMAVEVHNIPRQSPKSEPARRRSKVSDLRKLFDRASAGGSSPSPLRPFWRNCVRAGRAKESESIATTDAPTRTSEASDTYTSPLKTVRVPELTTEISVNDFSCDFTESSDEAVASKPKIHFGATADTEERTEWPAKNESPIKERIQQFERLNHRSPAPGPINYGRSKSYDANVRADFKGKEKDDGKRKAIPSNWHPLRQQGAKLWRRISSSFTQPPDDGNDSSCDSEPASSNANPTNGGPSRLSGRRPRYRRSSLFGYHFYRTSEVIRSHSSTSSSHDTPSIDIDEDERITDFENQPPHIAHFRPPSRTAVMRKTFPFLAHMSDSLGFSTDFDDFGLDGAMQSKITGGRDISPAERAPRAPYLSSSPSTPRSDPHAFSKVVSKQVTAERKRRRLEEKQLRRERRKEKKEDKTKGKGKEKEQHTQGAGEQGEEPKPKAKGKEKETSWSKKTASGFVVRQVTDIKLRHPKPRRPGQVKKIVNLYKEKAASGINIRRGGDKGGDVVSASASAGNIGGN